MRVALAEARRVLASDGRLFTMSLTAARGRLGSLAQHGARASGIQFPTPAEFNALAQSAGLRIARQHSVGVVTFSLMTKEPGHDEGQGADTSQSSLASRFTPAQTVRAG